MVGRFWRRIWVIMCVKMSPSIVYESAGQFRNHFRRHLFRTIFPRRKTLKMIKFQDKLITLNPVIVSRKKFSKMISLFLRFEIMVTDWCWENLSCVIIINVINKSEARTCRKISQQFQRCGGRKSEKLELKLRRFFAILRSELIAKLKAMTSPIFNFSTFSAFRTPWWIVADRFIFIISFRIMLFSSRNSRSAVEFVISPLSGGLVDFSFCSRQFGLRHLRRVYFFMGFHVCLNIKG